MGLGEKIQKKVVERHKKKQEEVTKRIIEQELQEQETEIKEIKKKLRLVKCPHCRKPLGEKGTEKVLEVVLIETTVDDEYDNLEQRVDAEMKGYDNEIKKNIKTDSS